MDVYVGRKVYYKKCSTTCRWSTVDFEDNAVCALSKCSVQLTITVLKTTYIKRK